MVHAKGILCQWVHASAVGALGGASKLPVPVCPAPLQVQQCTRKCVPTCIRGGQGAQPPPCCCCAAALRGVHACFCRPAVCGGRGANGERLCMHALRCMHPP